MSKTLNQELKKTEKLQKRTPIWLKILFVVLTLLVLLNTFQLMNFNQVVGSLGKYNGGLVDELGAVRGSLTEFSTDLNEIRRFLLLPEKTYQFENEVKETLENDQTATSENELAVYKFLQNYTDNQRWQKNKEIALNDRKTAVEEIKIENYQFSEMFNENDDEFLPAVKLVSQNEGDLQFEMTLIWDVRKETIVLRTDDADLDVAKFAAWKEKLIAAINKQVQKNQESAVIDVEPELTEEQILAIKKKELELVFEQEAFQSLLKSENLKIKKEAREEQNKLIYDVVNAENQVVFAFAIEVSSGMFKVIQGDQELDLINFLVENDQGLKKKL